MRGRNDEVRSKLGLVVLLLLACTLGRSYADGSRQAELNSFLAERQYDPNELRWDLVDAFKVAWDSVELSARACNPVRETLNSASVPRALTISATLDILDANDLVAVCVDAPVVVAAHDANGHDVALGLATSNTRLYDELRRAVLPQGYVYPFTFSIQVPFVDAQVLPPKLSSIQGYIYAMYAEDVIEADIPLEQTAVECVAPPFYEPATGWINVAPDLQIRVLDAYVCGDYYEYDTEVRSLTGVVGSLRVPTHVGIGDWVGDYVVVKAQLTGRYGTAVSYEPGIGMSMCTRNAAGCSGTWGTKGARFEKIRHTIAIHPVEVKIPFELIDIPVPSVDPVDVD